MAELWRYHPYWACRGPFLWVTAIEVLSRMAGLNGWAPEQAIAYGGSAPAEFRGVRQLGWSQDLFWRDRWLNLSGIAEVWVCAYRVRTRCNCPSMSS